MNAALMSEMAMYIKENDLADEYKKIAEKTKEILQLLFCKRMERLRRIE